MFTLAKYIEHKGIGQVAKDAGVTEAAVSQWKRMVAVPRPELAGLLIEQTNGLLSYESIYAPYVKFCKTKKKSKTTKTK